MIKGPFKAWSKDGGIYNSLDYLEKKTGYIIQNTSNNDISGEISNCVIEPGGISFYPVSSPETDHKYSQKTYITVTSDISGSFTYSYQNGNTIYYTNPSLLSLLYINRYTSSDTSFVSIISNNQNLQFEENKAYIIGFDIAPPPYDKMSMSASKSATFYKAADSSNIQIICYNDASVNAFELKLLVDNTTATSISSEHLAIHNNIISEDGTYTLHVIGLPKDISNHYVVKQGEAFHSHSSVNNPQYDTHFGNASGDIILTTNTHLAHGKTFSSAVTAAKAYYVTSNNNGGPIHNQIDISFEEIDVFL
jgi:hypothetical protein